MGLVSFEKFDPKKGYPRNGMQVTLEGGPFHGQVIEWSNARGGRFYEQALLEGTAHAASPWSENAPEWFPGVRRVVYELDRWNEARTAGIAKCIDDGKCKTDAQCQEMESRMWQLKAYYKHIPIPHKFEVVKTKGCGRCGRPLEFTVRQLT